MAPQTPAAGAGIATLNPIPEVPRGDVDLIAPLGTIDPGEAGVRSSGNVNVAALHVVNAANIQAQGNSRGAGDGGGQHLGAQLGQRGLAAAASAESEANRSRNAARQSQPSIISVQILGFGNDGVDAGARWRIGRRGLQGAARADATRYAPDAPVQVLGQVDLDQAELGRLTQTEQRNLARLMAEGAERVCLNGKCGLAGRPIFPEAGIEARWRSGHTGRRGRGKVRQRDIAMSGRDPAHAFAGGVDAAAFLVHALRIADAHHARQHGGGGVGVGQRLARHLTRSSSI